MTAGVGNVIQYKVSALLAMDRGRVALDKGRRSRPFDSSERYAMHAR